MLRLLHVYNISSFTSLTWFVNSVFEYCCCWVKTHNSKFTLTFWTHCTVVFTLQQRNASQFCFCFTYCNTNTQITHLRIYKTTCKSPFQIINAHVFFPEGYVGMQLVPKTTRNPHQIGSVVLRLGTWSGAGRVWGGSTGKEGQTAGPVPVPLPRNLRGLDTSVRQKQTSRRDPSQTGVPWQRFSAEVSGIQRRTHRQVSSMCEKKHAVPLLQMSCAMLFLWLCKVKWIVWYCITEVKNLQMMPWT